VLGLEIWMMIRYCEGCRGEVEFSFDVLFLMMLVCMNSPLSAVGLDIQV